MVGADVPDADIVGHDGDDVGLFCSHNYFSLLRYLVDARIRLKAHAVHSGGTTNVVVATITCYFHAAPTCRFLVHEQSRPRATWTRH
jgi:hypothetical protein